MSGALLNRAVAFAVRAHEGQKRKEGDTPYIVHPVEVALILAQRGFSDTVLAAALVHDVVEDTPITLAQVQDELGEEVAKLVAPLTHDGSLAWEEKKKAYIETIRAASDAVKAISTADKIANAHSLLAAHEAQGKEIWTRFNRGRDKKIWFENAMLAMLRESWKHPLVDEYAELVAQLAQLSY